MHLWYEILVYERLGEIGRLLAHQMFIYKHPSDFCGPVFVFLKLFLKTWSMLCVHRVVSQDMAVRRLYTTCLYTTIWAIFVDRFCVHRAVSQDDICATVVYQMLVYKHLGDFRAPCFVLTKLFLKTCLCNVCAPNACIQASGRV